MNIIIYLIIFLLYVVLLFWTWNNTKDFEKIEQRIAYMGIGLIVLGIITFIIFNISKIGVNYPSQDIVREIRKISLLLFIPINGFFSLPHIASIKSEIRLGKVEHEKSKKKIIILGIMFIVGIIIEIIYLKDFQNGIIQILNAKS